MILLSGKAREDNTEPSELGGVAAIRTIPFSPWFSHCDWCMFWLCVGSAPHPVLSLLTHYRTSKASANFHHCKCTHAIHAKHTSLAFGRLSHISNARILKLWNRNSCRRYVTGFRRLRCLATSHQCKDYNMSWHLTMMWQYACYVRKHPSSMTTMHMH